VTRWLALPALAALAACGSGDVPERQVKAKAEPEAETVDIPQSAAPVEGTTPMAERVAVIGLLNKRNGLSRDLEMRPGQALRVGDVIVRLRACERTAAWEQQQLTGAFVQLDVGNPQGQFNRVFSGWLYKETPSLNVVEHPVYDVWPKSCAMTHPGEADAEAGPAASSSPSSAPKAAPATVPTPEPEEAPEEAPPVAADSNEM